MVGDQLGLWKYEGQGYNLNRPCGDWVLLFSSSMYMLVILSVLILNLVV